jgi:hypothetical protein
LKAAWSTAESTNIPAPTPAVVGVRTGVSAELFLIGGFPAPNAALPAKTNRQLRR